MADPRFYDNCGPFTLADICAKSGATLPEGADGGLMVDDVASLSGAGATHLSFFSGSSKDAGSLAASQAGFVFIPAKSAKPAPLRDGAVALPCGSVQHAFAAAAGLFYPESNFTSWPQQTSIDRTAEIGEDVMLAPGVVIGPGAEIGDGTRIGPNTVIGRGVAVGKNCEIASNVSIAHAYIGDAVVIFPGVQIGAPGFGFASGAAGHVKIPQLGRVIIQDRVEIGSCTTIDRGALGDTVVGEGTKIDNLVQIGHNTRVGRHCVIVSQVGISGSCEIGDYVVLGGQVGIADHCRIGTGARLAARSAMASGQDLPGGQDYGGVPAKPVKEWMREIYTLAKLTKKPKRDDNG